MFGGGGGGLSSVCGTADLIMVKSSFGSTGCWMRGKIGVTDNPGDRRGRWIYTISSPQL